MDAMTARRIRALPAALLAATVTAGLAGCGGSQTKTVTVANTPASTGTASAPTQASTPTATTPAATTPSQSGAGSGGTAAPSTTRTATEPAFTEATTHGEGESAAAAVVREHGYTPQDAAQYHSGQALRVLVGTRTGSGDGYGQQAFFFVNGRYLGTDAKEPSASVKVVSQSDTEVTLAYPLYRHNDPLCCPGGGQATVHFALNNGQLTALGTIPPSSRGAGLSRY